jgi:hypothetical protein
MIGGALTSSPMWLPWAAYWVAWAVVHAVWWWLRTATLNAEALAPAASVLYWLLVWASFNVAVWGWRKTKTSYGIREAVDFGSGTTSLGSMPRKVIQGQTRLRVFVATYGLVLGSVSLAALLLAGILGAWTMAAVALWGSVKLNTARRVARRRP